MRVQQQPAYVLRTRAYSESSLLVEVFSREFGRLALIAKGARRRKSPHRGVLRPFQPLALSWAGRGALPTLTGAETTARAVPLRGGAWLCGFYLNELMMLLLHRHDAHEALFDTYARALASLCADGHPEATLRLFEKHLLSEIGYALVLDHEAGGRTPVRADRRYDYVPDQGPTPLAAAAAGALPVSGATLLALAAESLETPETLAESKQLLRAVLSRYLDGRTLSSRRLFRGMQATRARFATPAGAGGQAVPDPEADAS